MFGTIAGNATAIAYFFIYQILGMALAATLLKKEKWGLTLLLGSSIGSFGLQWLPTLFSFFMGFTRLSHFLALFGMILITLFVFLKLGDRDLIQGRSTKFSLKEILAKDPVLFLLIPTFIFTAVVLTGHTLSPGQGFSLHSGQSTYGDMNMHLGFITSIAKQGTFPPDYSILPGTKLAYPFLSDSISSSLYIWGSSLRLAYLLPMYVALAQVFFGMYEICKIFLTSFGTSYRGKSILAFALFFFNGGFGFWYFINQGFGSQNFSRIFTEFYQTPTNYVTENVQWHNIIADMLIPQRATLFGWAILFPLLALLLRGRKLKSRLYFIIGGVLAGGLVLIHTHSFLALGVTCAVFLLQDIIKTGKIVKLHMSLSRRFFLTVGVLLVLQYISLVQMGETPMSENLLLYLGYILVAGLVLALAFQIYRNRQALKNPNSPLLRWGIFLGIVLVLALPQLIGFTFQQAQGEHFLRGGWNWANNNPEVQDSYIIFYLKNLGIMFILPILSLIFGEKRQRQIALPGVVLWLLCEFILFQPNPYDNNKLLLVAYLYLCIAAADFVWDTLPSLAKKGSKTIRLVGVCATAALGVFAAVLTLGREYVSDYELYDQAYVNMCQWVEENTDPKDTFLTANNHNNAVASLTGRNIVCGSSTFLFFHGVNYQQNESDVYTMYQNPNQRADLLAKYNVKYIVLGAWEYGTFTIPDADQLKATYPVVYADEDNNLVVLQVQ
ncbi:MAG: hypothetical protein K6G62_01535 [Eubacterium sp.]|nr:hypothetical protein [Eubacterium sp.]